MAKFKVTKSRVLATGSGTHRTELNVILLEGQLQPGDKFWAFETHHPFEVTIRAIRHEGEAKYLVECEASDMLGAYEGFFDRAVVDTSGRKRGVHFFWDHDNRYPAH